MTYRDVSASAVFLFNEQGRFRRMSANRHMGAGPEAKPERWVTAAADWGEINDCLIPVKGGVTWKLDGGGFTHIAGRSPRLSTISPCCMRRSSARAAASASRTVASAVS